MLPDALSALGRLTRRWVAPMLSVVLYTFFSGVAMADDYFADSYHSESRRHAILQLDGSIAYLYLTAAETQKPERDVVVFSTGELVEPEVAVASAKAGNPPALVSRYASSSAVYPEETFWELSFRWSEDGNAVAVFLKSAPIAYVSAQEKSGKSRALSVASFFGDPWNEDSYTAAFGR